MSHRESLDKETPGGHVPPPVPPETYRWEELRRQRALGGYPWAHLDKPPLGSRDHLNDHEYEPINPRPQPVAAPAVVAAKEADKDADKEVDKEVDMKVDVDVGEPTASQPPKRRDSEASSIGSGDPNFIRVSLHEDAADPGALKDEAADDKQLSPLELQTRLEERYFAATPTTTESRTDCDVNTSQLDSSGLEDLPLRRGSRKKKQQPEEEGGDAPARGFQQRIRSQAGRLRAKLRSMKMPERPKFNMPERPKFNLPDRPKFNMPDRPKFNMPERPKFNFPDRPKFSMPSMPSFSRSKTAKTTSSVRRPLRDRAANPSTESNASSTNKKSHLFDFDFRTYPRIFDRSRRRYATSSPKSTPRSQTPPADMEASSLQPTAARKKGPVGSRWVHRFTDIKYVDDEDSKPDAELRYRRGDSPDVRVVRLRDSSDEERDERAELEALEALEEREDVLRRRRTHGYDTEVRDAVEELERQKQERDSFHTDSTSAFHDKDYGYAVTIAAADTTPRKAESLPDSDKERRSSGSSSDRHRAGVLEEIDSDEFFLREKGISREDVDVERYLTSEIRDAFRAPENALAKMDDKYYYDDDDVDVEAAAGERGEFGGDIEPVPPVRSKSLQKPKRKGKKAPLTPEEDTSNFFNTFPPSRPKRHRRGNEETSREEALVEEEQQMAPPTFLITQPTEVSFEEERNYRNKLDNDDEWVDDAEMTPTPPTAPRRTRRSRQEEAPASSYRRDSVPEEHRNGLTNGHRHEDDDDDDVDRRWSAEREPHTKNVHQEIFAQYMESDYIIPQAPDSPPVAPRRGRRHASRGPSVPSLGDEDATSRGADSLPSERDAVDEHPLADEREYPRIGTVQLQDLDLAESGGYATVEKIYPAKPARSSRPKPPPRPPPPTRKKRFFSLPRRTHAPPTRPLRNYSTLGPSRPARRERAQARDTRAHALDDDEDAHGSSRDLSSGVVIEKMKGRPLPAPPRPPRKERDTREGSAEQGGDDEVEVEVEEDAVESVATPEAGSALGALNDRVFYRQLEGGEPATFLASADTRRSVEALTRLQRDEQRTFLASSRGDVAVEEVSIATQTDPLPDDFCMEVDVDDEPRAQADACTETHDVASGAATDTPTSSSEDRTSLTVVEEVQRAVVASRVRETPPPQLPPRAVEPAARKPEPVAEPAPKPEPVAEPAAIPEPAPAPVQAPPRPVEAVPLTLTLDLLDLEPLTAAEPVAAVVQAAAPVSQPAPAQAHSTPETQAPEAQAPSTSPPPVHTTTIIERQVPVYIMPDEHTVIELKAQRLQVCELDVDKLNVGEISAHKILVSDIDGVSMQVAELTSKSGKLMVNGIELPPGFLQEIYDAFPRPSVPPPPPPPTPTLATPQPPPVFPPPPAATEPPTASSPHVPPQPLHIPLEQMYSFIPSAMRVPRARLHDEMDSEEEMLSFVPASHRRRRHHPPKHVPRYSSDEDEEVVSFVPRRQARSGDASASGEASVLELGRQLATAVQGSSLRAVRSMLQYTAAQFEGEDKRRELQTAICILLVLVAGLILMGYGTGKAQHHHHWDYFNPPNN